MRKLAVVTALAATAMCREPAARADSLEAEIAKLNAAGRSIRWNDVPAGRSERYGHAQALVQAPLSTVRAHVTSFNQYKTLVPHKFNNARIVGKEGDQTDVYFQVGVMHGAATLWFVLRFSPVRATGAREEILEGTYVKGNVKDAHVAFVMTRVDDNVTLLRMDLMIVPSIPAPQSALDEELRDAAADAVNALHDRAQGNARTIRYVLLTTGGAP